MNNLKGIKEVKNIINKGEEKMEKILTLKLKKDVTKGEKMNKVQILKYDLKDIALKKELILNNKIKYAMLFKHSKEIVDGEEIVIYYPEIVLAKSILDDINNPALKRVKEQNEKELREFLNELPKVEDIERKPVLKEIYDTAEFGIKILVKDIGYSEDDLYNIKYNNKIFKVTKGELITFGIWKETNKNKYIPTLGLGPEKVIYFHKSDKLKEILSIRNLLEEFNKMESPQKQFQRLHKVLSPLTDLSEAKVYIGDTNKLLGIGDTFTEGVLLVSNSYAKENNLVEGAKLSYTLKSLIHIVPDNILNIDNKQYDLALTNDENKWKLTSEKLGSMLKAFTGKTPDINAKVYKMIKFKPNNMFFTRMSNRLTDGLKEKLDILKQLSKYSNNIDELLTKEGNEFKPEFEKFLFDLLSIEVFDKNKEIDNSEDNEVNKMFLINKTAQEILNIKYINNTDYIDTDGSQKHTDSTWMIHPTESKPKFNRTYFKRIGKNFANMLFNHMICADFVGCSGTVLPMSMKASDAYPIAFDVTMYKNEYTKERLAKMEKLGIAPNMMYVQRHPSMLGVWTELLYSPSKKLFYVDEELWQTFFGGDFDGDNFVGLYPFHSRNAEVNNLLRKIVDPIDNDRMTALIDKGEVREFLTRGIFDLINKLENKYTEVRRDIMLLALDKVNPNFKEVIKGKKNPLFKKHPEFANWAKVYDKQQMVGKIHAIVCNALSFFVKNLTVKDELQFSTYFILKHIQPAIEGLKQKEEGFIPDTKSLIAEMMFVYEEMFGTAKFKNLHIPKLEDVVKHKQIYSKIRGFETIGLINDYTGEYDYNDLYYKKEEYKEIAERIKTSWTELYLRIIKFAEKYFKDTDLEPTTPTPKPTQIKTSNIKLPTSMTPVTPVIPVKNTFENMKKEILKEAVMKNTMKLFSSVSEQKTDMKYDVDILGQYWLSGFKKNANVTIEENINLPITESDSMKDMINKYYEAINNVIPKILEKVNFYLSEGYEYKYITKVIMVPEEISILIKQCKNNVGYVYDSDCFAVSLDKLIIDLTVNHHIDVVSNQTHLPTKEFDVKTTSFNELDDDLQNFIYDDVNHISVLNINPKLYTKELCTYYGSKFIFKTKKKYYAGIGSRQTPADVLSLMEKIAKHLSSKGMILRSGHAEGADQAFERGCYFTAGQKEIFIANDAKNDKAALDLAASIHPAWDKCSEYAKLLHARNGYIILGEDLKTPVDFVICHYDETKKFGGTRQAIKLAQMKGIKVYNLWKPNVRKAFEERLASLNK